MRSLHLFALLVVTVACSASALAQSSFTASLAAAVSATQVAQVDYAFDFHLQTSDQTWQARYEPEASPRLRLVSPRLEDLDGGARRAFDGMAERMNGVSWCASEEMQRVADLRLLREDADTATYAFQPTRESIRSDTARNFADRLRGEMTLTKTNPDITRVRIFAPAPFSPIPLTQLQSLSIDIRCQLAPNGRRYAAETLMELRGTAFGQAFNERSVQRASNLTAS